MDLDMTSGKPLNRLIKFSLPLLAGSVIQNLYNIFDTAIVGHMLGKYALAAVGNSYVPTLIINSVILPTAIWQMEKIIVIFPCPIVNFRLVIIGICYIVASVVCQGYYLSLRGR